VKNILVGADLTANSENAFIRAIQLAQLTGARLHVLHVDRRLQIPGTESETAAHQSQLRDRLRQFVQSRSGPSGIDYDVYLATGGRAYEVVAQRASSTGADLLVVGRR
jgi:nucleotide-binding universal stress UspA family protein